MTPMALKFATLHAATAFPREACGVLVEIAGEAAYRGCRNLSLKPKDTAIWHHEDLAAAEDAGRLLGYVHSHPNAPATPSRQDRASCEAGGLPWWIISWPGGDWSRMDPLERPLEGRQFVMGVDDCYSLVRDWYREALGIELRDFLREPKFWERGNTPHLDHYAEAGFEEVQDDLRPGDVLLMRVCSRSANHSAVYLGGGDILHHLPRQLSRREMYDGRLQGLTTHRLRFKWA